MAREKAGRSEGIYVEEPKNDVYFVMLIFTALATIAAIIVMRLAMSP